MVLKAVRELLHRSEKDGAVRTLAILAATWAVLLVLGVFLPGFVRADSALLASLALRALLVAGIVVASLVYLNGDLAKGYRGFKAFAGYALFFSYVASAITAAAWHEARIIAPPSPGPPGSWPWSNARPDRSCTSS
jgi:hypothetical protein